MRQVGDVGEDGVVEVCAVVTVRLGYLWVEDDTHNAPIRFWMPWIFANHSAEPSRAFALGGGTGASSPDGYVAASVAIKITLGSSRRSRSEASLRDGEWVSGTKTVYLHQEFLEMFRCFD